jgi:hypothetical protein
MVVPSVARLGGPPPVAEEAETVVEPGGDLLDGEDVGAGGCKLERER